MKTRTTDNREMQRKVNASTVNPIPIPDDGDLPPSDGFKKSARGKSGGRVVR